MLSDKVSNLLLTIGLLVCVYILTTSNSTLTNGLGEPPGSFISTLNLLSSSTISHTSKEDFPISSAIFLCLSLYANSSISFMPSVTLLDIISLPDFHILSSRTLYRYLFESAPIFVNLTKCFNPLIYWRIFFF